MCIGEVMVDGRAVRLWVIPGFRDIIVQTGMST